MRKFFLLLTLAGCLIFSGCDVREMSSLKEISLPYAGEYFCQSLTLGGKDVLPYFERAVLTLERDGSFSLAYKKAGGGEGGVSGAYRIDEDAGRIYLRVRGAEGESERAFPYENGRIFLEMTVLGRLLCAEFAPAP